MNFSWSLVQKMLALAICSGLLAACQDRGSFEARVFSAAEKKSFCSKSENTQACIAHGLIPDPAKTQSPANSNAPAPDQNLNGNKDHADNSEKVPPAKPNDVSTTPKDGGGKATTPKDQTETEAAKPKPLEAREENPFDESGAVSKNFKEDNGQAKLLKISEQDVATVDEAASQQVRGISLRLDTTTGKLLLNLEALVMIGEDLRFLTVSNGEIAFNKDGHLNKPLTATLQTVLPPRQVLPLGNSLSVSGLCSNEACDFVYIRLDFSTAGGSRPLVFKLDKNSQWNLSQAQTNHAKVVPYEKAIEELMTPVKPPEDLPKKNETTPPAKDASATGTPDKAPKTDAKDTRAPGKDADTKDADTKAKSDAGSTLSNQPGINTRTLPKVTPSTATAADGKVVRAHNRPGMTRAEAKGKTSTEPTKAPTVKPTAPAQSPTATPASPKGASLTTPQVKAPTTTPKTAPGIETTRLTPAQAQSSASPKPAAPVSKAPATGSGSPAGTANATSLTTTVPKVTLPPAIAAPQAAAKTTTPVLLAPPRVHNRPGMKPAVNYDVPAAPKTEATATPTVTPVTTATATTAAPEAQGSPATATRIAPTK